MNPFYFGSSAKRLYGVYHPPQSRSPRDRGIVLCYPFGQEYMRAHRAYRQLTTLLTRAGYHTLRFDYHATGDSGGDSDQGTIRQWIEDVDVAIDELKEMAGVEKITLVGLRLGAALAARASTDRRDLADVVLWDPVVRGADYIAELLAGDGEHAANGRGLRPAAPEGTVGVLGFPLTATMRAELDALELTATDPPSAERTFLVVSHQCAAFTALRNHLQRTASGFTYEHIPSPGNWNEVDNFGSILMPQQVIQGIVKCLT